MTTPTKSENTKGTQGEPAGLPRRSFDTCHKMVTAVVPPDTVTRDAGLDEVPLSEEVLHAGGVARQALQDFGKSKFIVMT